MNYAELPRDSASVTWMISLTDREQSMLIESSRSEPPEYYAPGTKERDIADDLVRRGLLECIGTGIYSTTRRGMLALGEDE